MRIMIRGGLRLACQTLASRTQLLTFKLAGSPGRQTLTRSALRSAESQQVSQNTSWWLSRALALSCFHSHSSYEVRATFFFPCPPSAISRLACTGLFYFSFFFFFSFPSVFLFRPASEPARVPRKAAGSIKRASAEVPAASVSDSQAGAARCCSCSPLLGRTGQGRVDQGRAGTQARRHAL